MIPTIEIDDQDGSFYIGGNFLGRLTTREDAVATAATTVTVPSAALYALRSNPFQLLPSPGDGFIIHPLTITVNSVGGTAAYLSNNATLDIGYTIDGSNNLTQDISGQTIDRVPPWISLMSGWRIAAAGINQPLWLLNSGKKDFTAGGYDIVLNMTFKVDPISAFPGLI